jgi:Ca-activated chloride channel family protein
MSRGHTPMVLAAAIWALCWASPTPAQDSLSPYDQVAHANTLYGAGKYREAAEGYQAALGALPDSPEIHFDRGDALFKLDAYTESAEEYALALQTQEPMFEARVRYNMGIAKYMQALEALNTLQDAMTPVLAAMEYYRESLRLNPDQPDARYNLELAHRIKMHILSQRVEQQQNAGVRDQKASDNAGQAFDIQRGSERTRDQQNLQPDPDMEPQGAQGQQAPNNNAVANSGSQTQNATAPTPMSPDEAGEMVELIRERARAAESQRQSQRQARMREGQVERFW